MPNLKKWSGLFSILVTEILNLRDCSHQVRQRELLGAFSRHTAAGTSSNAEVRFLARRYGITDRRVWQLLKQEAELPAEVPEGPGAPLRS